jgi:hypothetical protein
MVQFSGGVGQEKRAESAKVNSERIILFSKLILSDQHVIYDYTYIYIYIYIHTHNFNCVLCADQTILEK